MKIDMIRANYILPKEAEIKSISMGRFGSEGKYSKSYIGTFGLGPCTAIAASIIDENNNVYMVKQFRKPCEKVILEIPAGKIDKDEEPINCGIRELEEETGLKAHNFISLGSMLPSPGYTAEVIHIYLALDLYEGEVHLDEGEFLSVEKYHIDELVKMIMDNEIRDAKTVIGILKAKEYLHL